MRKQLFSVRYSKTWLKYGSHIDLKPRVSEWIIYLYTDILLNVISISYVILTQHKN